MLHTYASVEAWSDVRVEFTKSLALRSQIRARGVFHSMTTASASG